MDGKGSAYLVVQWTGVKGCAHRYPHSGNFGDAFTDFGNSVKKSGVSLTFFFTEVSEKSVTSQ
jgi:hypothetical protein